MTLKILSLPLVIAAITSSAQQTYYIKHDGNDAMDGKTPATAWLTINNANTTAFNPGDSILFEAGFTYVGTLTLGNSNNGTSAHPIAVSTYNGGMATLQSSSNEGINLKNKAGISIRKLVVQTSNAADTADGVRVFTDLSTNLDYIHLDSLDVSGFATGISVGNHAAGGFSHVSITRCQAHDNRGNAGIAIYSDLNNFANTALYIGYCKAYNNTGYALVTTGNTGSGIVVGGVDGGVVEYCEAYSNGANNGDNTDGPIGIWTYQVKNITIQFCESHNNFAGLSADGGGFDLDGGSQNCIIQYCYSHNNEGAGLAIYQYAGAVNANTNNIIRYNISENDGRKNGYGGITLWGNSAGEQVTNSALYGNTIYVDDVTGLVSGIPSAVKLTNGNLANVLLVNNIFYVSGANDVLVYSPLAGPAPAAVLFQNNDYYEPSGFKIQSNGSTITDINGWRALGQEKNGATQVGLTSDPVLTGPLPANRSIGPSTPGNSLTTLTEYKLRSTSPAIDAGANVSNSGSRDYFGNPAPIGAFDIGANEFGAVILPVHITGFTGKVLSDHSLLTWTVDTEINVASYQIQKSSDGINFQDLALVVAAGQTVYTYADYKFYSSSPAWYRIKVINKDGSFFYSEIIELTASPAPGGPSAFGAYTFQQGNSLFVRLSSPADTALALHVYDIKGRALLNTTIKVLKGDNLFPLLYSESWSKGLYFIDVLGRNRAIKLVKE